MRKNVVWLVLGAALGLGVIGVSSFTCRNEGNKANDSCMARAMVKSVYIPEKVEFANEVIPLDNFDVRESLDRELTVNTYFQSQTLMYLKRAKRFFPIIEPILKKNGVPDDFKYLCVAESGLMNEVSPAGASGFWQFMRGTAKEYGLEVNDFVDERFNLEKATEAACRFLLASYKLYGNWSMAAASYNTGRKNINKQIGRQLASNYYDLYLNSETARYVFRIVSFKLIMENPSRYGFVLQPEDTYPPIPGDEVRVDSAINSLPLFAAKFNTNYKVLKIMNPWLRDNSMPNKSKKVYTIKVPKPGFKRTYATFKVDSVLMDSIKNSEK